ncbi:hypothetical protein EDB85DRAFT_1890447 [Lactarius pseudohatsudake]|nr:hypothetical protein EDB85DRAFT_1890447 [Lactarius pseudohatsudake]
MQPPLKRKRDEFPTTPQKLMKIQLTVGRRLTCVVPGPLVIPATPSPPPPPPPEDQALSPGLDPSYPIVSVWNLLAHAAYAYALVGSGRKKREKEGEKREKEGKRIIFGTCLRPFRLLVKWEDDGEQVNLCGAGQSVVIRICATSPSGKRRILSPPMQCQKLPKSSSADSVQENTL